MAQLNVSNLVQDLQTRRDANLNTFEAMLMEILRYNEPDPRIFVSAQQTTTASQNGSLTLEPPAKDLSEWIILGVAMQISAQIDANDVFQIIYRDAVTGQTILLSTDTNSDLNQNQVVFPTTSTKPSQLIPTRPLKLKRRNSDDSWLQLQLTLAATATVGNRLWFARLIYATRPRLND
jgi:hypothetical protein